MRACRHGRAPVHRAQHLLGRLHARLGVVQRLLRPPVVGGDLQLGRGRGDQRHAEEGQQHQREDREDEGEPGFVLASAHIVLSNSSDPAATQVLHRHARGATRPVAREISMSVARGEAADMSVPRILSPPAADARGPGDVLRLAARGQGDPHLRGQGGPVGRPGRHDRRACRPNRREWRGIAGLPPSGRYWICMFSMPRARVWKPWRGGAADDRTGGVRAPALQHRNVRAGVQADPVADDVGEAQPDQLARDTVLPQPFGSQGEGAVEARGVGLEEVERRCRSLAGPGCSRYSATAAVFSASADQIAQRPLAVGGERDDDGVRLDRVCPDGEVAHEVDVVQVPFGAPTVRQIGSVSRDSELVIISISSVRTPSGPIGHRPRRRPGRA